MTGAEAIQTILEDITKLVSTVKNLETSIHFIEANIKMLNNRAAGLMQIPKQEISAAVPITLAPQLIADVPNTELIYADERSNILTYKKVFGKLINNVGESIDGVLIRVFDKNNEVCSSVETDVVGYFEFMLRPGRYSAEYTKVGFKTVNKTFDVNKNAKETEIK